MGGTSHDLTLGFTRNPAGQIASTTRSNDSYAWLGHGNGTAASAANGLNQVALHGGVAPAYDARGNLAFDPTIGKTYGYSSENLLISVGLGGGVTGTMAYDPLMRLAEAGVSQKTGIPGQPHRQHRPLRRIWSRPRHQPVPVHRPILARRRQPPLLPGKGVRPEAWAISSA